MENKLVYECQSCNSITEVLEKNEIINCPSCGKPNLLKINKKYSFEGKQNALKQFRDERLLELVLEELSKDHLEILSTDLKNNL